jgi:plastocyanin domain-containing protein
MTTARILVLLAGLAAIGWIIWYFFLARRSSAQATIDPRGVQEVTITVQGGYQPSEVRVRAGRPVRIVFDRRETNPCSEEVVLSDFAIRSFLPPNRRTAIEFTPTAPGTHEFVCGMGMLHGKVIVT